MCACTTPSKASLSTSTVTVAWEKNPGVFPSPAGPGPLRPRDRPLKIDLGRILRGNDPLSGTCRGGSFDRGVQHFL
jgi:hypothetical protein